ncbi:cation diffusion facilitator family transporter [Roseibium salinum]|uniref:Cation diffusion facilitator family transporter n=1 Tax=Roseibium salinum TaxID=1604349 RepID=A0ABT3R6W7_9HYPH|nr:cation diffusion facilitator family transporter [Roseibium sp. DSM 29163]MCX2725034.1 cation diffusion facilitator family transporter [Roseibium sp. DSM 29163]MDN3721057.1 cation diffusion facilitator family transporter [Roseibium salinum]
MDLKRRLWIAFASIIVGLVVFALKLGAYWLTGSVALFSDALETTVNIASSIATLAAVWFAAKPADSNHPYGHDKAEYFAAVLVGVMIVLAALSIFRAAWMGFISGDSPHYSPAGIAMNVASAVIIGVWARYLIWHGKKDRSPALTADGKHLMTDVVSSVGVLGGVVLVLITGWTILDPALAVLVGLTVLWSGWELVKESVGGLMDEAASAEVLEKIRLQIAEQGEGALEAHDLRTRIAGKSTFVDFHLVVPGSMPVETAHEICDRIEAAIAQDVPGARITIHVEPEHKAKHSGIVVL